MIIQIEYNGECLCLLAKKYKTTVRKICDLNLIDNISYIKKGEKLLIEVE